MTMPSEKALVPFVSVQDMMALIHRIGLEEMIVGLVEYLEHDFRRWALFDKTPRVAAHSPEGVIELMPFAKAVSAKSDDFDDEGNDIHTDYERMMKIVLAAGYSGYVGIEYEGGKLSPDEGIMATKKLLERVRESLA